jgi:hypothetical protein
LMEFHSFYSWTTVPDAKNDEPDIEKTCLRRKNPASLIFHSAEVLASSLAADL